MADILEKLRNPDMKAGIGTAWELMDQAGDEIEGLRKAIRDVITSSWRTSNGNWGLQQSEMARLEAALNQEPPTGASGTA